ncbi:YhdT family protein [Rossellomorea sp. AcN35-11]|nr:YhdT family protein [Rossellomorea aquimaris]NMH70322.1 YhdT family protein [Bacillus sp. RO3]WJV28387.1 YhdT family protein [Rossellomorea sp. AcN35-11]
MNHQEDKRFKVARFEALIGIALVLINFLWWYGFAFGMGGQAVSDYEWILGMPSWFFYSCIVGFILMVFIVMIVVKYLLTDIPFDEEEDHE